MGMNAAQAAQKGYLAEESILEVKKGFFDVYGGEDIDSVTRDWGKDWDIVTDMAIKLVPGGHPNHGIAEAAVNAAREGNLAADEIETITMAKPLSVKLRVGPLPQPPTTAPQCGPDGSEIGRAQVGHHVTFEPPPHRLDGVELRRVGRQAHDGEPSLLAREERARFSTAVRVEAIPDEHDRPFDVSGEVLQEDDDLAAAHGAAMQAQQQARRGSGPRAIGERADGGELSPAAAARSQDPGLAARRPRPADRRPFGESAFVEEDERRAAPRGVFFRRGQVSLRQRATAASSCSRARVVGRCSDQPSPRRSLQTWPG